MARGTLLTEEQINNVCELLKADVEYAVISRIVNVSNKSVYRIGALMKFAESGDIAGMHSVKADRTAAVVADRYGMRHQFIDYREQPKEQPKPKQECPAPVKKEATDEQLSIPEPTLDTRVFERLCAIGEKLLDAIDAQSAELRATRDAIEAVANSNGRVNGSLVNLCNSRKDSTEEICRIINANCDILFNQLKDMDKTMCDIRRKKGN